SCETWSDAHFVESERRDRVEPDFLAGNRMVLESLCLKTRRKAVLVPFAVRAAGFAPFLRLGAVIGAKGVYPIALQYREVGMARIPFRVAKAADIAQPALFDLGEQCRIDLSCKASHVPDQRLSSFLRGDLAKKCDAAGEVA